MDGSADYIVKNINRKLLLLAGYCVYIDNKAIQQKAGEIIAEIQDTDLPLLQRIIENVKKTNR